MKKKRLFKKRGNRTILRQKKDNFERKKDEKKELKNNTKRHKRLKKKIFLKIAKKTILIQKIMKERIFKKT